jgi:hypothetical protein
MDRPLIRRALVSGAVVALVGTLGTSAASAAPAPLVLAEGLSSPKGVAVAPNGNPVVSQGAFGPPGPVVEYLRTGPARGTTVAVTDVAPLGDIAIGPDGAGWGIGTDAKLYRELPDGSIEMVLDIAAYQTGDPDPNDLDGDPTGSNPYGLAVLPNGDALVADAQNNDVLRVTPDGEAVTVARFLPQLVSTADIPFPPPPETGLEAWPEMLPAEAVPTGLAVARDGWVYVSELKGFPFAVGSSNVYRLNPWAEDATCSTDANDDCAVAHTGLTSLIDVAVNPNNGHLYTYGLAAAGTWAFEEALMGGGDFPAAVLTELRGSVRRELASGQLSQPGGVAVARDGTVFVTDGVFGNGRLVQIRG